MILGVFVVVSLWGSTASQAAPKFCGDGTLRGVVFREHLTGIFWFDVLCNITNCGDGFGYFNITSDGGERCGYDSKSTERGLYAGETHDYQLVFDSLANEPPGARCFYTVYIDDVWVTRERVVWPTLTPTALPSPISTDMPTPISTSVPTLMPTPVSTRTPTQVPTPISTHIPTLVPTALPTTTPTYTPTPVLTGSEVLVDADIDPRERADSVLLRIDVLLVTGVMVACGAVATVLYHMSYRKEASARTKMKKNVYTTYMDSRDAVIHGEPRRPLADELNEIDKLSGVHIEIPLVWLGFINFVTNCVFVVETVRSQEARDDEGAPRVATLALTFLLLPFAINAALVLNFMRVQFKSQEMKEWLKKHSCFSIVCGALAFGNLGALKIVASQAFGCLENGSRLRAPLTLSGRSMIRVGALLNILLEDIPQCVLQMIVWRRYGLGAITAIAAITSALTLAIALLQCIFLYINIPEKHTHEVSEQARLRANEDHATVSQRGLSSKDIELGSLGGSDTPLEPLSLKATSRNDFLPLSSTNGDQEACWDSATAEEMSDNSSSSETGLSSAILGDMTHSVSGDTQSTGSIALNSKQSSKRQPRMWRYEDLCKYGEPIELGSGNSGVVFTGNLPLQRKSGSKANAHTKVVFKVAKQPGQHEWDELATMVELNCRPHPHVLKLVGACLDWKYGSERAIVAEFHCGGSMKEYIKKHDATVAHIQDFAFLMASAVAHMHAIGILHRDIALRNFVLSEKGMPVLIDFGLAMKGSGPLAAEQDVPYRWSAPEALGIKTHAHATEKSDVYSLGIAFWELFHKANRPFAHIKGFQEHIVALRTCETTAPLVFANATPSTARTLIARMCSIDPERRPTAREVCRELHASTSESLRPRARELARLHRRLVSRLREEEAPMVTTEQQQYCKSSA